MPFDGPATSAYRCEFRGCRLRAWRRCALCGIPVCRSHRAGSNHLWRCLGCPGEDFAELRRAEHLEFLAANRMHCTACGALMRSWVTVRGYRVHAPNCACKVSFNCAG
jgi:hypothetical protein